MGLFRVTKDAITGTMSDQWLESIQANNMTTRTIMTKGIAKNQKKHKNASEDVISDGSLIQVEENQMMLLVDGGKIIDYSAEPGYFGVNNENAPSLFNGDFQGSLSDAYNRFRFGGTTPYSQKVYYINTQEIKDIPFGTPNAINYFDNFYNAELYLRAHGYYSIRITNPIKFYAEMVPRDADRMEIETLQQLCLAEFLTAFQSAIGKLSVDGVRISHVSSKTGELANYMARILDASWEEKRGFQIESVGISSISYDEQSQKLINMRNEGAMLGNANVRAGYVAGSAARGVEAAGNNPAGSTGSFVGMNMGMNAGGNLVQAVGQQEAQSAPAPAPVAGGNTWVCAQCQTQNTGNFCSNCGNSRPTTNTCSRCQSVNPMGAKFCSNCGNPL